MAGQELGGDARQEEMRDQTNLAGVRHPRVPPADDGVFVSALRALAASILDPDFRKEDFGSIRSDRHKLLMLASPHRRDVLLWNGWHSDKTGNAAGMRHSPAGRWIHVCAVGSDQAECPAGRLVRSLGSGFYFGFQPVCWSMPTLILGESAAAATFGLINSMGQLGGFLGPSLLGSSI